MSSQVRLVKVNKPHRTTTQSTVHREAFASILFFYLSLIQPFLLKPSTLWNTFTLDSLQELSPSPKPPPHLSFRPLPPILQSGQTAFFSPPELQSFLWPACTCRQLYCEPASPSIQSLLLMTRQRNQSPVNSAAVRTELSLIKKKVKNITPITKSVRNCW